MCGSAACRKCRPGRPRSAPIPRSRRVELAAAGCSSAADGTPGVARPSACVAAAAAEVAERLVDGRQARLQPLRQRAGAARRCRGPSPATGAASDVGARAALPHRLSGQSSVAVSVTCERVALAEQREQAVGVVGRRSAACPASGARPDSSAGTASVVWLGDRGRVAVPGRVVAPARRSSGSACASILLSGVHQHVGVELVEHDDHDRRRRERTSWRPAASLVAAAGPAWRPARRRRKSNRKTSGAGAEHRQHVGTRAACARRRTQPAAPTSDRRQRPAPLRAADRVVEQLEHERRGQAADEDQVERRGAPRGQRRAASASTSDQQRRRDERRARSRTAGCRRACCRGRRRTRASRRGRRRAAWRTRRPTARPGAARPSAQLSASGELTSLRLWAW